MSSIILPQLALRTDFRHTVCHIRETKIHLTTTSYQIMEIPSGNYEIQIFKSQYFRSN